MMRIRVSSSVAAQFAALGFVGVVDASAGADGTLRVLGSSTALLLQ